ncbi:YL1-domain-containing protein [Metschnikowia bicuspidata var. bicuspidata NRRL YB-4993]|uniref:YL1-domain-containing protein n=1 Tax=Metschnikowia bicuspidata var. bicuspidata NRRL YB-4993 TaxID=869754 RepID=A0A1A0HII5_9ASCO|nr:YL1-domain-containing protein [Metschnikowia bicuspidata var. bicuspidata NRRL YB-4993]OBA23653.1 YL1-domain-containing protein [Metschnikowia bicuspidata var. bicuspidata NRRL YB-4993]
MSDKDSLVATRARRANAGSRLKQLIELEEQASSVPNIVYSEEDENVQLLFQEDENDEEFEESDDDGSDHNEEDENSEEEEGEFAQYRKAETQGSNTEGKTPEIELAINSDEMLSDSDLSASENDESEGERELQKTEKEKKRKTKTSMIIPAIKKPKLATEIPKPKKKKTRHSELLLDIDRRASSRKSAMKNKEILVQKLKEDETRRATLTPVVRAVEAQLTQEERLAQAVETEKENVLSLHSFLEQEIVKKEHQKLLFQQRRPKLRNVIRLSSKEVFVAPIDEIEDARHVQDLFEKKKKGRRRKAGSNNPEEPRPGDIDKELPYYKKEMEEKRRKEEEEAAERERLETQREEKRRRIAEEDKKRRDELEEERESRKIAKEERYREFENGDFSVTSSMETENSNDQGEVDKVLSETHYEVHLTEPVDEKLAVFNLNHGKNEGQQNNEHIYNEENVEGKDKEASEFGDKEISEIQGELHLENETSPDQGKGVNIHDASKTTGDGREMTECSMTENKQNFSKHTITESAMDSNETKEQAPIVLKNDEESTNESLADEKKVSFAISEEHNLEVSLQNELDGLNFAEDTPEADVSYRADKDGFIYEGPVQHVGRNDVILINFDDEQFPHLQESRIKTILFGKDANLGASRRFKDVKTILKSSIRLDNPYAAPKGEEENDLLRPVTDILENDAMFEALKKLPRLGTKETFEVEEENEQKEEAAEIQIRTEAPSGLYLPNGNKKLCLISGKEARYFDPATGLPYENKDMYRVIKTIEQGLIPWYSIGKDQNTYGEIQIYLNHRNGSRHAKGVPEGFDGC